MENKKIKALIIDDEEGSRKLIIHHLKKEISGMKCEEIATKEDFLNALEKGNFDIVTTEYHLRWGNGIEVLRGVKKKNPFTPVIMFTGAGTEEVAVEAMKYGLDDYIIKKEEYFMRLPAAVRIAMEKAEAKKKEGMLSSIIESAKEAAVSVDKDGKIIYANKATEELFGWKIEELIGKPMSILAVDANEQKKQFMEALRKGGARFETVRKAKDGSIIPVLMTVVPFKDENGNLIFSSGIMVDIREQKKYEFKIEHLNEVLHAIRNVNQLITKEKNEEKLLQKACEILVKVKGYTSVCISYKGKNYTAGEEKECKKALDFIKKRGTEEKEITSYKFNKRYLIVSPIIKNDIRASLYIIHSREVNREELGLLKEISGDIAFALDSIDKERELKEKETLLSHVFESVQDGISILDTDLTIKYVNSAMEKWYEKNMPLVGKKCYEAYHNRKKPCDPCPSLRCMKSGRMERNIVPGLPGSRAEWIELFSYPIKDEYGNVTGVVEFVRDITERKKAEEKLKESEARFRGIFENATVGMYRTTPDGKILMANPFLVKLLGYESEDELKRRDLSKDEYYEPGYKREKFIKEIEKKGYFVGESAWKRKDGSTIFVRESAVAVRDEDGKTLYYDGVVEDITELKKTHDELAKARDDWKAIFNSISDPVIVLAKDHTILDANPATLKALGKKREEVIGKKCFEFFHGDNKAAEGCPMEKLLRSRHPETESMEMDALGGIFLVTVSPVFEGKEITKVIHHAKNITKLKQLIEALQESEEKFRGLVENAHDAIYIITPEGFQYVNPAFEELTGYSSKEILSKEFSFWNLIHPDDIELIKQREKARIKGKEIPSRYEFRIISKDEKVKTVEVATVDIGKRGEARIMGILRDVTERKKAEEEIKKLSELHYIIGMSINGSKTIKELCSNLIKNVKEIIGVEYANIFVYNRSKKSLEPIAHVGYPKELAKRIVKRYEVNGEQPWEAVKACLTKKERYLGDVQKYKPLSFNWDLYKKYDIMELYTIPLVIKGKVEGVLQVSTTSKNPLAEKKRLLKSISEEIAAGIAKIKAEEEMMRALELERKFKMETAHHFFNPIAIAKGYLDLAMEELPEEKRKKLKSAKYAIGRVEKVVKNVTQRGEIRE